MRTVILILLALTIVSMLCAFDKGTINPGGTVSYSSFKVNSDADAISTLVIAPQVGYFVINNLAVDGLIDYVGQKQGDITDSSFDFGIGGRYFFDKFYGGLGLLLASNSTDNGTDKVTVSGHYLDLKAGYLLQPARNVYLDLGLKYRMGFGDYGSDGSGKNEESMLMLGAGLQIFYHTGVLGQ
jgi:hypothetical protein